jgi:nucleoside-diphosphate-sugar epimerase
MIYKKLSFRGLDKGEIFCHTITPNPLLTVNKILLTGATGFIGSNLTKALIDKGLSIGILKRRKSQLKQLEEIKDKIIIYNSDTPKDINIGIKKFKPEIVIHLAANQVYKQDLNNINDLLGGNIILGTDVLQSMLENNIRYFLNIGTRWQHIENKQYNPANLYAATKEAFKNILLYFGLQGIHYKTIELPDTYGEGDPRPKVFNLLINSCKENKRLDLSPGEQMLDLLYVQDICNYIITNIQQTDFFNNDVIALSGKEIKLKELGKMVEEYTNTNGLLNWGGRCYRENEVMIMPNYYPKIKLNESSLEMFIKKTIEAN